MGSNIELNPANLLFGFCPEMGQLASTGENTNGAKENARTRTEAKILQLSNSSNTLITSSTRPDANLIDLNSPAYDKPKKDEGFLEFLDSQNESMQPSHRPAENQGITFAPS